MRRLLAAFFLLTITAFVLPTYAQDPGVLYNNGPVCPRSCQDAWQINGGYLVTDSLVVNSNARVTGFDFWTWEYPGDRVLRVEWSISSDPFGGTVYGTGMTLVHDMPISLNEYGFEIDKVTVTGLNLVLPPGTYWLTLQNAVVSHNDPVYWDENSGDFCHSPGCPSSADENSVGTIPSETFDVRGVRLPASDQQSSAPTSSGLVWGSLVLGLLATVRRFVV